MSEVAFEIQDFSQFGKTTFGVDEMSDGDRGYARGPVRSLMSALLFDGVQAYMMYETSSGATGRQRYREAFNWVHNKGKEYIFSFDSVCEALGIDADFLRYGLVNASTTYAAEWKRARRNF